MCGIAGEICLRGGLAARERPDYAAMWDSLAPRGPDQRGAYYSDRAVLLHRRLCVVDPVNGRQPMRLERNGRELILAYNGELYNTPEIRRALRLCGHRFEGHSDTEVVLHAFDEWGERCLNRFNGIYAFAVWEPKANRLFLARDRMGVKPLFYAQKGDRFLFGSEIKALLAHPDMEPVVSREGLLEVLLIGPGRTPGAGVFRDVRELEPGHAAWLDETGFHPYAYWQLKDRAHTESVADTVAHVRHLVTDAIRRQLVSDVPVGTFLSGGLDSSLISAVAAKELPQLRTYSVDYVDNDRYFQASHFTPGSDNHYIDVMNDYLRVPNTRVVLNTKELADALYDAVRARDLPGMADVDSSFLLFSRRVKHTSTVVLSGECADEIFGGYPWYRDPDVRRRAGFPWAQSTDYRASFIRARWLKGVDAAEFVDSRYRDTLSRCPLLPQTQGDDRRIREMTMLNMRWFMQTLLDRKDRMSMACGLEVRVPFCDHRIAEYMYGVPWAMKDLNGMEKGLLREAAKGLLPDEVRLRKKSPYPKTHHPAYLAEVSRRLRGVIADPDSPIHDVIRTEKLAELLNDQRSVPWYGQLMTTPQTIAFFLQLNYWLQQYRVRLVD